MGIFKPGLCRFFSESYFLDLFFQWLILVNKRTSIKCCFLFENTSTETLELVEKAHWKNNCDFLY